MKKHYQQKVKTVRRIIPFFKDKKAIIGLTVLLMVVGTTISLLRPLIFREIVDHGIPSKETHLIFKWGFLYLLVLLLWGFMEYIQSIILGYLGIDIVNKIKRTLYKHVLSLPMSFFDKHSSGTLVSRIESDSQKLFMLFSSVGLHIMWAIFNLIISLIIMFNIDVTLSLIVLSISPLYTFGAYFIFKKLRPMYKNERKLYANISSFLSEHIRAIPLLGHLNNLNWSKKKLKTANRSKWLYERKIMTFEYCVWFVFTLAFESVIVGIFYKGISGIEEKIFTIGTMWMFIQYIHETLYPLMTISEQIGEIQRSFSAADRIFEIFDRPSEEHDKQLVTVRPPLASQISFENISFAYEKDNYVLNNVSFTIKKGESTAIVGPTGSGKTTLISLLMRFYLPQKGQIKIDGIDHRNFDLSSYRKGFGLILQDIFLFPENVLNNLRVLRQDIEEQKVIRASKLMGAYPYIQNFSNGLYTELSEGGQNLSYGERQLLSLSRCLTFDPQILIMDEATSAVDPQTEEKIQSSLTKLLKERTSIVIAHRLSTIKRASKIIVMKEGQVAEEGDHQQLLNQKGVYENLYTTQMGL